MNERLNPSNFEVVTVSEENALETETSTVDPEEKIATTIATILEESALAIDLGQDILRKANPIH